MVECADGSLYTGWTFDLERRLREHNEGTGGAKYTYSRRPVKLVWSQEVIARDARTAKISAMRREAQIKLMPRRRKLALIEGLE